jgi:peptidyl-prolyl cis-trans isomerase C
MRLKKSGTLIVGVAMLLTVGACNPAKPVEPVAKDPAAATVNGTPISQKMVDLIAKRGVSAGRPDTPATRATIIEQLTLQVLLAEEAIKKGLDKTPEVIQQIEAVKQSVLANAYVEDFLKAHPVSDDAVKAEYDRIKATITGTQYKARHILVARESEAKDIIAKLKKDPGAFVKLAAERSTDLNSKEKGGGLGWFDLSRVPPEFGAAVSKLEKGKFTQEPVKTPIGYDVILLEDSKPIEAPPFEDVKAQLTQQLQQQSVKTQVDALKAAAKIDVVGAPAATAPPSS